MRLPARLEAFFWERSAAARRWLRRQRAGVARWRRRWHEAPLGLELVPASLPALERSFLSEDGTEGLYHLDADAALPEAWREMLLLGAAAWEPALIELGGDGDLGRALGLRRPTAQALADRPFAVSLPLLPTVAENPGPPLLRRQDGLFFQPDEQGQRRLVFADNLDRRLEAWPILPGPPTVLFLLPFLAVGGAERLLLDLLDQWAGRYRCVIVTLERHAAHLGQTVDQARVLTPWVFTLGDWLPREAHLGALCHLLRRLAVDCLCSWNGTIFFYDQAAELRRRFPGLRIAAQLYHHEGGFFARSGPEALAAVDVHLAVNHAIAGALRDELGVRQGIELIHHGVETPALRGEAERLEARRWRRRELGLPEDVLVVGTFARLHPQKRPFDAVALAKRLAGSGPAPTCHFLWVGGGPLEEELRRRLAEKPVANFHWRPMVPDARTLFDAVDLCLLPSEYEGLPVFLLDGLARGLPCVATAVGEIPYLLSAGGGMTAEVGDLRGLEAGIRTLLDPARRRLEGERGRANVAAHFGLESFARAYRRALLPEAGEDGAGHG